MKITQSQIKALNILRDHRWNCPITPRRFAELMWKDTETNMFTSSKNQGNGATRGKAAWLCGGSYLGKLRKRGWVNLGFNPDGYYITDVGLNTLLNLKEDKP